MHHNAQTHMETDETPLHPSGLLPEPQPTCLPPPPPQPPASHAGPLAAPHPPTSHPPPHLNTPMDPSCPPLPPPPPPLPPPPPAASSLPPPPQPPTTTTTAPPSPSLDFLSPRFDPLRALHTPGLVPPLPGVRPLDNVSQCRKLLPGAQLQPAPQPANEESRKKHERFKEAALRLRERIHTSTTVSLAGVLAAAAAASPGPMQAFSRWHAAGARVSVTTRHASGVRGCATGVLAAYDRYMNVVLRDVTEQYTVVVRQVKEWTR
ncbi:hypothetical protein Agub_g9246, partial [Astrephomene gubernaculifera]